MSHRSRDHPGPFLCAWGKDRSCSEPWLPHLSPPVLTCPHLVTPSTQYNAAFSECDLSEGGRREGSKRGRSVRNQVSSPSRCSSPLTVAQQPEAARLRAGSRAGVGAGREECPQVPCAGTWPGSHFLPVNLARREGEVGEEGSRNSLFHPDQSKWPLARMEPRNSL